MLSREYISKNLYNKVLKRDGNKCTNCGSTENLEVDHCLPYSLGGSNSIINLRTLCSKCNSVRNKDISKREETLGRRVNKALLMERIQINKLEYTIEKLKEERDLLNNQLQSVCENLDSTNEALSRQFKETLYWIDTSLKACDK